MTHRRLFLRQLAGIAATASMGPLLAADEALAQQLDELRTTSLGNQPYALLRSRYLLDDRVTYLNHGSIGTVPRVVHEAHTEYLRLCERNPWLYVWGDAWEQTRESIRAKAASYLGAEADEIAITHNTTEGFNVLAWGLPLGRGDEVLFSSLNHDGASICWQHVAPVRGYAVRRFAFPVLEAPQMNAARILEIYDREISARTRVLVFPHVDNVVGLRHPARELTALARERGVDFVAVDGAQTVGMFDVDVGRIGADVYCASPHKWLQAPKGLGLMHVGQAVRKTLRPMWVTWGQDRWKGTIRIFEDYGTRNLPELVTLGDAIDFQLALDGTQKQTHYRALHRHFQALASATPSVEWRSPRNWELGASLYAVEVRGHRSTDVFQRLFREHGFVFRAFATPELNTIRISPNLANTYEEADRLFATLTRL